MRMHPISVRRRRVALILVLAPVGAILLVAASEALEIDAGSGPRTSASRQAAPSISPLPSTSPAVQISPTRSPNASRTPRGVYASDAPGNFSSAVAGFPERVYVPNTD